VLARDYRGEVGCGDFFSSLLDTTLLGFQQKT
jgi:hypothetical protein